MIVVEIFLENFYSISQQIIQEKNGSTIHFELEFLLSIKLDTS